MELIFSTEQINRYGYRVLTDGIDVSDFEKNPVLMLNHDTYNLPIGKIENLRKEGGKLIGTPVFDEGDERAMSVKRKLEGGFLNASSIHFSTIETSINKLHLLKGQTRPTVTKSSLVEISIATIPGNAGAVKLNLDEGESLDTILPELNFSQPTDMNFKNITAKLNLGEDATEVQILSAIEKLQADSNQLSANNVNAVIAEGKAKGFINDDNEGDLRALAATNLGSVKSLVEKATAAPVKKEEETQETKLLSNVLGDRTNLSTADTDERKDWTFDDWSKKDSDGLLSMKNNESEKYKALALSYKPS